MLLTCGVGEDSWESLGLQGDQSDTFYLRLAREPSQSPQYLVSGPNEAQILAVSSQKEFSERQSDRFSSVTRSCPAFCNPKDCSKPPSLSVINSWSLLKLMSIKSLMPSNHLNLCCPLLFPPSIFPSIRVFSKESVLCIRWPKYWSFSFNIRPSNEYSGLISFRMDWLDLLAVQGTLKSLLQHHSSKASVLRCSAFFIVQLSHRYVMQVYVPRFFVSSHQRFGATNIKALGASQLSGLGQTML